MEDTRIIELYNQLIDDLAEAQNSIHFLHKAEESCLDHRAQGCNKILSACWGELEAIMTKLEKARDSHEEIEE